MSNAECHRGVDARTSYQAVRAQEHLRVQTQAEGHHPQHPHTQLVAALEERRLDLLEAFSSTRWPFLQEEGGLVIDG